jgi:alpha-L-fucosidase
MAPKLTVLSMILTLLTAASPTASGQSRPLIKKLGTVDCDMVETTPVVFKGRLYRFESVRKNYQPNQTGSSYFRFIDVRSGKPTPAFAAGYHLGSAFVEQGTVYVYGVERWGASKIQVFWSEDLKNWESQTALALPGWGIYNTSVCQNAEGYAMAFEIDKPPAEAGVPFTNRFALSTDLRHWKLTPSECVYSRQKYTACPALRFFDGRYYLIYLEAVAGPTYETHIVRSRDLIHWENTQLNPVLQHSPEDKLIANPQLTPEQRELIARAVDINNSDVDLCEFNGRTIIYYSWGNQKGTEFLGEAVYKGNLAGFLRGFFP